MSDNKSRPIQRRHSQVFVDVPLSMHSRPSSSSEQSLKENTPLRPSRTNSQSLMATLANDGTASKKRRLTDADPQDAPAESLTTKTKKARVASAPQASDKQRAEPTKKPKAATTSPTDMPSEEYPHGYFYCHQCNRKRDRSEGVRCTFKNPRAKAADGRCGVRYCKACLKNRYNLDMETIMSRDPSDLSKKQKEGHILSDGYYFRCPKCQDDCNCRFCRKAKGLEPTGNLHLKARQAEKAAAAEAMAKNGIDAGSSAKAKVKKSAAKKADKKSKPSGPHTASKDSKAPKAAPKPKAKPKPLPRPVWTRVATDLAHDDAVARLHIREFCIRFASALQLSQSHLDELEEPSGDNLGPTGGWDVHTDAEHDVIAWVGELCARSVIQGLLDLIADVAEGRDERNDARAIQDAARAVKASGANLNRVWASLAALRDELESDWLSFSDPTSPPASTTVRTTRSGLQNKEGQYIHIASSAQLVPVITDLINAALEAAPIRDLLETGATEEKELSRSVREAVVNENTRWKNLTGTKDKTKRELHNRLLRNLDGSHRVAATRYIPRFAPLGQDTEGRVYYALSPGVGESDAALQFINGKDVKPKIGRKRIFTEDERREMQRWSWFIAVWGKKPEAAEEAKNEDDDEEEEDQDENEEAWWGFWQPTEVKKLAEWVALKSGVVDDSPDSGKPSPGAEATTKLGRGKSSTSSSKLSSLAASRAASPLSELSTDDEDGMQMQVDSEGRRVPLKGELRELVAGLRDYAVLLEWRIQRVTGDSPIEKAGKASQKTSPVPTSKFYA